MNNKFKILIVDDEPDYCDVLAMVLQTEGYQVQECYKPKEAVELIKKEKFDLILSDLIMPEMDGISLMKEVKKKIPDICFIIMTAYGTIENAVTAMKEGAYTYTIKGNDPEELLREIDNIRKLQLTNTSDTPKFASAVNDFMMDSKNAKFQEVLSIAAKAAKSDTNILILGESGVGKEVLARFIYQESKRKENQFLATNCCTFTESLLESELFGHEKGAFTGAVNTRIGRFEAANGGTLFLDEIGDVPLSTQAKLLRAIETKTINRIGKNDDIKVDFRLISATNKSLENEIKESRFREDLFYRLSTIIIEIPPLRERKEDLPDLIRYFMSGVQKSLEIGKLKIDSEVMDLLLGYHYPGNIRELKNIVERMAVLSENGEAKMKSVSNLVAKAEPEPELFETDLEGDYSLRDIRREVESKYIASILKKNRNNITQTAKELDISRRQLFNKITEYGLKDN